MAFARIHLDGTVDTNFGNNGLAVVGPGYGGQLYAVVVQSDGSIVGAGEGVVVRVLSNGSPDATFSVDGVAEWTGSPGYHEFRDLTLGPNGTIVAAGYANTGKDFAVVRVKSDGAFDQDFGVDGMVKIDFGLFGYSNDQATSVLSYANGKILVSGVANGDFALARIDGTPTLGKPGKRRPDGLLGQVPILPSTQGLFRPGFLLSLVERIDRAIAEHRVETPTPKDVNPSRSSVPASRTNDSARANQSSLLDDFFAELGDETSERGGSNSNIANHPHQLTLRVSGSH